LLQENKKAYHKKLIHALWADRISPKRSIATSPFHIIYGMEAIFPSALGLPIMKLLQEQKAETDANRSRDDEFISVQQTKEKDFHNAQLRQDKIKEAFDIHTKVDNFELRDLVLKWDVIHEDKGKHGKFDHLWLGPFKIAAYRGSNSYLLQESNGDIVGGGHVNGRFLKHYIV